MIDLYPEFFRRVDERPDAAFYDRPRGSTHLDEAACRYLVELHDALLPASGRILDLMSAARTHLSDRFGPITGLGLCRSELSVNAVLEHEVVFDLNRNEDLPFHDAAFDAAICVASVQYMTRPTDTFAAVARVLTPGAPFVVSFSNRMFPTKAVLAWRASDDAAHIRLVQSYFRRTEAFADAHVRKYVPPSGDPVYTVWARTRGGADSSG